MDRNGTEPQIKAYGVRKGPGGPALGCARTAGLVGRPPGGGVSCQLGRISHAPRVTTSSVRPTRLPAAMERFSSGRELFDAVAGVPGEGRVQRQRVREILNQPDVSRNLLLGLLVKYNLRIVRQTDRVRALNDALNAVIVTGDEDAPGLLGDLTSSERMRLLHAHPEIFEGERRWEHVSGFLAPMAARESEPLAAPPPRHASKRARPDDTGVDVDSLAALLRDTRFLQASPDARLYSEYPGYVSRYLTDLPA